MPPDPHDPVESYARGGTWREDGRPHPYRRTCAAICCADVRAAHGWKPLRSELERIAEKARARLLHALDAPRSELPDW